MGFPTRLSRQSPQSIIMPEDEENPVRVVRNEDVAADERSDGSWRCVIERGHLQRLRGGLLRFRLRLVAGFGL